MLTQCFEVGLILPKAIQPYREIGRAGIRNPTGGLCLQLRIQDKLKSEKDYIPSDWILYLVSAWFL